MNNNYFRHDIIKNKDNTYILCFPEGGGVTYDYHKWNQIKSKNISFLPVTLPGHEKRITESPKTSINRIVSEIAYEMHNFIDYHFSLFGSCFGGIIAYELACLLDTLYGMKIERLYIKNLVAPSANSSISNKEKLHLLSDKEFINKLVEKGVIHSSVLSNKELINLILPGLKADYQMFENYIRSDRDICDFPITVFFDDSICNVTMTEMNSWHDLTDGHVDVIQYTSKESSFSDDFFVKKIEQTNNIIIKD